jgi:pimeloyl-ACP methyl ester carboxylesterase
MKSFLIIVCFALLSNFANASEIKKTTFAYWDKSDVEILYITPNAINEDTEVIFVIHGNNRNADDYLSAWIPLVQNKNVIIAAPIFDKKNFRYFFLLESAESNGTINERSDSYINTSISLFFNYFKSRFALNANTYKMFGHSAGAQFTHRYMLLSNDQRISDTVIANAGWYTFLNGEQYPYGIKDTPIEISRQSYQMVYV